MDEKVITKGEDGAVVEASESHDDSLNADLSFARAYVEKTEQLAKDGACIVIRNPAAIGNYLKHHTWCREQICECLDLDARTVQRIFPRPLPYILLTAKVREAYEDVLKDFDPRARNAKKLYDPADLCDLIRDLFHSTVSTVLVPLPFLSDHPSEMRSLYLRIRKQRMAMLRESPRVMREQRLSTWPGILDLVRPEFREHVGRWFDDLDRLAEEQDRDTARVVLKSYRVPMPDDVLPRFCSVRQVADRRHYNTVQLGNTTVRIQGWIRHKLHTGGRTVYSPGYAVGGPAYAGDYREGLLDLMTAERFDEVFGIESLFKWPIRYEPDEVAWSAKPLPNVSYKLPSFHAAIGGHRFVREVHL